MDARSRALLAVALALLFPAAVRSQDGPPPPPPGPPPAPAGPLLGGDGLPLDPVLGLGLGRSNVGFTWVPDQRVAGQPSDLGLMRLAVSTSVPLYQDDCQTLAVATAFRSEWMHTGAILPDSHMPFPEELYNVHLGLNYRYQFDNGWMAGGGVSVGSASDRLFHSIDEMTLGLNTFLRIPQGEHNAWLFTLSYSANSQLPIPIPGVAYVWQPDDSFRVNIGLPFQLFWAPVEGLTLDCSYMLLTTVHARLTYHPWAGWQVYTAFDWTNEGYFLADRPDTNDRFYYYEKRVTVGVRYAPWERVRLEAFGGYAFDRFYFQGHNNSDQNNDRVDVGDGPFLGGQVQIRW
jgi:hypothetical protein